MVITYFDTNEVSMEMTYLTIDEVSVVMTYFNTDEVYTMMTYFNTDEVSMVMTYFNIVCSSSVDTFYCVLSAPPPRLLLTFLIPIFPDSCFFGLQPFDGNPESKMHKIRIRLQKQELEGLNRSSWYGSSYRHPEDILVDL